MAVRFLDLYSPEIESTYASLPLEFINQKITQDQAGFDKSLSEASAMNANPIGLKYLMDETGNSEGWEVEDYNRAQAWANQFNQNVDKTVQDLYSSGDYSRVAPMVAKLNKEHAYQSSSQGILGINKAREEEYKKLQAKLAEVKNLPNSYWRSLPYINQIQQMKENPNYIPPANVAYADYVDRIESTNKIMSGIADELFGDPKAFSNGKYIYESKKYGVTEEKIKNVFEAGLMGNPELKEDIDNQIRYEYLKEKPEEEWDKYYTKRFGEEATKLYNVALKNKKTLGDKSMKGDPYGQANYEYELNNPSLPIISEHGATGVTKGSTFNDWRKALDGKNNELKTASANTTGRGLQLIQAAGITDKNTIDYIVRQRNNFKDEYGNLDLNKIQNDPNIKLSRPLNAQDISNLQAGFAFYNEAYDQEKSIERERDNMQVRVDNLTQNFTSQYNTSAIDKEFEKNKDVYSGFGINSSKELLEYITNNPENASSGYLYDDQGKAYNIQGLAGVSQKLTTDLNDYFEKNSFADSYVTLENASDKRGIGIYNKGITEHFKKDPVALLNSRVDGTTMVLRDFLKKNKIDPDKISLENLSVSMIGNSMLDGGTGLMVSVKDGSGKKLAEVPISDDGIQWGARDQILNQAYFDLKINPSTSQPSNQQYANALYLSKGNVLVGTGLREIDTRNMQPGEQNTIVSKQGVEYTITKLPIGGYTVTSYGTGDNSYTSSPEHPLTDDNSILQYIGNIEFEKSKRVLTK